MKKIFYTLATLVIVNQALAQQSEKKYNGFNGAGVYIGIAGGSMIIAGASRIVAANDPMPVLTTYKDQETYDKVYNKWKNNQKTYNNIFGAGLAVAGLSMIFAGADLYYGSKHVKINESASLQLKADPTQVGLCLHFK